MRASDIAAVFPGLNNSAGPVGAFVFDSRTLTNGLHTISWVVRDNTGAEVGIGSRFFKVQNSGGSPITETAPAVRGVDRRRGSGDGRGAGAARG